ACDVDRRPAPLGMSASSQGGAHALELQVPAGGDLEAEEVGEHLLVGIHHATERAHTSKQASITRPSVRTAARVCTRGRRAGRAGARAWRVAPTAERSGRSCRARAGTRHAGSPRAGAG